MLLGSLVSESRIRRVAAALATCAWLIQLAGCGFGIPLKDPASVTQQSQRSAVIHPGESTRESVQAALGEPWLQSRFWGFDIYRAYDTAKELGGPVILIFPIPIGVFTWQVEGYVLVTYDEAGRVTQVSSGNTSSGMGDQEALMLRAQDLYLGVEKVAQRGPHLMADAKRLQGYLAHRRSSGTCTVVLACEESGHQKWPFETCPDQVVIDNTDSIDPQPFFGSCDPVKSCPPQTMRAGAYIRVPMVYPITLSPGRHRLVMTSSTFKSRHESYFECAPGEVRYGVIHGHVNWDWWSSRTSTLDTTVLFSDVLPAQWSSYSVLLYRGNRWFVQQEPDRP